MVHRSKRDEVLCSQLVELIPRLRRFAMSLAGDPDRADDLVQQACERALQRFHQLREGTRLDSWLYRILYTRWIDRIRQVNSRKANLRLYAVKTESIPAANRHGGRIDDMMDLRRSLGAIPEENRAALSLICIEGLSYAEASSVLDVPPGTVASRVARARAMLAEQMNKEPAEVVALSATGRKEVNK
jgi:RNA polymerase sigma-70 factor (ECF subfamily)